MPVNNLADQQAAHVFESTLRIAVQRRERPPLELQWYDALPERVQSSGRLTEFAVVHSLVLLEHIRSAWGRTMDMERERETRLARAKALPRDLECLRAPDPNAWNGLGCKKKRSQAFEAVGRAYNTRRQLVPSSPATDTAPATCPNHLEGTIDAFLLHPSSCHVPKRPATPPDLRESMYNIPGLVYTANVQAIPANYGFISPCSPSPPPSPPPRVPSPEFPRAPQPGEFWVRDREIDSDVAYIVAHGRHSHSPQAGYSAHKAALDVHRVEVNFPGALEYLAELLFPGGVGRWNEMADSFKMEPLVDFVHGWYDLSKRARAVR
ncbi:hypothetical protein FRC09_002668 [Ceratobasidium sp. 395]|nr:hypothetical protein FRC09_002668 [Ceratobasidium sp. 395]